MPTRAVRAAEALRIYTNMDGMSRTAVAREMGLSIQYVCELLDDPTGELARRRKEACSGSCEICGGPTSGSNGKAAAPSRCTRHSNRPIEWTDKMIVEAIKEWEIEHGNPPRCSDWQKANPPYWPACSTVVSHFGTWNVAIKAADLRPRPRGIPEWAREFHGRRSDPLKHEPYAPSVGW